MGKQSKQSAKSQRNARETAAAARAAAIEQERKRQRRVTIAIGAVIALVVVGIIGGALLLANQTKESSGATPDPDAALPAGAFAAGDDLAFGVPFGSNPDAPVLEIWEDPQCPACAAFETAAGSDLKARADAGEIYLVSRPTTFLDNSLGTAYSRLAVGAYGCAIDAGRGYEYKQLVLSSQPTREGDGWTDEQLIAFGSQVGIEGEDLATFEQCFVDRVYVPWAANSTEQFFLSGVGGTPTVKINGEEVSTADVLDPEKLDELISQAAAQQ